MSETDRLEMPKDEYIDMVYAQDARDQTVLIAPMAGASCTACEEAAIQQRHTGTNGERIEMLTCYHCCQTWARPLDAGAWSVTQTPAFLDP